MRTTLTMVIVALVASALHAQMEKRTDDLYSRTELLAAAPSAGKPVPDLALCDLEGRPWALSAFKGRRLVIIKGGYT